MANLNPNLISKDVNTILINAATIVRTYSKKNLYPEAVVLALIQSDAKVAKRIFEQFHKSRKVDLARLERAAKTAVETRRDAEGDLNFALPADDKIPLSRQMVIALDDALSLAQSKNEVYIDVVHLLIILSDRKMSSGAALSQFGITPQAIAEVIGDKTLFPTHSGPIYDVVAQAKALGGDVKSVYFRDRLLSDMSKMLSQKISRHLILIGADGIGKRSLVYSLGLLMAEGKGPFDLRSLVMIEEQAFLDNLLLAIRNGISSAQGGILFIPHIERFFGGPNRAEFYNASLLMQKTLISKDPVIIGTTTQQQYDERIAATSGIAEHIQLLRVPEPSEGEAIEIIKVLAPQIANEYDIKITDEAITSAVRLGKQSLGPTVPLPRSAELLLHRSATIVSLNFSRNTIESRQFAEREVTEQAIQASIREEMATLQPTADALTTPTPTTTPDGETETSPRPDSARQDSTEDEHVIFISYRREDSADVAGRIYDRLLKPSGPYTEKQIFKDVDSIPLGEDFQDFLTEVVNKCHIQLVIIGKHWLNIQDNNGKRRLDDPRDWVRIEIEAAISRRIKIVPLLVQGASMPEPDQLPDSLKSLAYRNGTPIRRDPDFHHDMDRLIRSITRANT